MRVIQLALQAAAMKTWPAQQQPNGELRLEIGTTPGRTQVVTLTQAQDGDNEPVMFIWSKAGELNAIRDPWEMLRLNAQLTYGRVAVRGNDVLILHALLDATADLQEVGKAIYWVGKAADDIEQQTYGAYTDVL